MAAQPAGSAPALAGGAGRDIYRPARPGRGGASPAPPRHAPRHEPGLELAPLPTAVPCARLHARARLAELGCPAPRAAEAEAVVSELATNAVRASLAIPGPAPSPVRVRISKGGSGILVEVEDRSPRSPDTAGPAADDDEGGRGLLIVAALAESWGVRELAGGGKVVWALVAAGLAPGTGPP